MDNLLLIFLNWLWQCPPFFNVDREDKRQDLEKNKEHFFSSNDIFNNVLI